MSSKEEGGGREEGAPSIIKPLLLSYPVISNQGQQQQQQVKKPKRRLNCAVENCGYSTVFAKDLGRHMRKHTGEKPFSCEICPKRYSRYDKLVIHIRTHTNEKKFKCSVCPYSTVDSGSLKKHLRVHNDERPYKCQICPYAARDSSQLTVHLRSHTGDCPFQCTWERCSKAFKTKTDLKRHLRFHTGDKPFHCPQCEYKATVKCNLNKHMRSMHRPSSTPDSSESTPFRITSLEKESNPDGTEMSEVITADIEDSCEFPDQSVNGDDESRSNTMFLNAVPVHETAISSPTSGTGPVIMRLEFPSNEVSESEVDVVLYDCKFCAVRTPTLEMLMSHMEYEHAMQSIAVQVVNSCHMQTDPLSTEEREPLETSESKEKDRFRKLTTYFSCSLCPATFVRADSLRCHVRQHSLADVDYSHTVSE